MSFCLSPGWSSIVSVYVPRSLCPSLAQCKVFPNQSASTSQPEVSGREIVRPNLIVFIDCFVKLNLVSISSKMFISVIYLNISEEEDTP